MEKSIVKKHLLARQEAAVEHLNAAIKTLGGSADLDETEQILLDDLSHQEEDKEMQMRMQEQLKIALHDLEHLKKIPSVPCSVVQEGALVITDQAVFFIGISMMGNKIDNTEVIGVSTASPIYAAMQGKTAGESFEMGKKNYHIQHIS